MKLGPGVTAAALASSRVVAHTVPPGSKDLHRGEQYSYCLAYALQVTVDSVYVHCSFGPCLVDGSTQQHKNQNQGYPGQYSGYLSFCINET